MIHILNKLTYRKHYSSQSLRTTTFNILKNDEDINLLLANIYIFHKIEASTKR